MKRLTARLTLVFALAVTLATPACLAEPAAGLRVQPIAALDPVEPERSRFGPLAFRGGLRLSGDSTDFGGWSAMRLEGDLLTAVNDQGDWLALRLSHDNGRLVGARREDGGRLRQPNGRALGDNKLLADAEGLSRWQDGLVVSFERDHRLWSYRPDITAQPTVLPIPEGMAALSDNAGVEAVVDLADGDLLMLAEEGGRGWIGRPGAWHDITWQVTADFKPTDMARLPGGDIVVLERSFTLLSGVAIRLSRLAAADLRPGAHLRGRELLRLTPPMLVDNFEALAVGRGPAGETMLYILSDDNFSALQATLLLAFTIGE